MKKFSIFVLFMIAFLTSCSTEQKMELNQPSLLLKYYRSSVEWNDIILGESSSADCLTILKTIPELKSDTISEVDRIGDEVFAIHVDISEGFRESDLFIWIVDGKAEVLEFIGSNLTLFEIENYLGAIEKFSAIRYYDHFTKISLYGYSLTAGYFFSEGYGNHRKAEDISEAKIEPDEVVYTILTTKLGQDLFIDTYLYSPVSEFLLHQNGFMEWHDYGNYQVISLD